MKTKVVKKSKLKFKDGYFFDKKGRLVAIDHEIVYQINKVEEIVQMYLYLKNQPKYQPEPSLEGFEFKSTEGLLHVETQTPTFDKLYEDALTIMAELDNKAKADAANRFFKEYKELVRWIKSDEIFITVNPGIRPPRVDTCKLGNPLEFSVEDFTDVVMNIATEGKAKRDE